MAEVPEIMVEGRPDSFSLLSTFFSQFLWIIEDTRTHVTSSVKNALKEEIEDSFRWKGRKNIQDILYNIMLNIKKEEPFYSSLRFWWLNKMLPLF